MYTEPYRLHSLVTVSVLTSNLVGIGYSEYSFAS